MGLGRGVAPRPWGPDSGSQGSEPVPVPLGGSQARGQLCTSLPPPRAVTSASGPGDSCPHWGPGAAVLTAALLSVGPLCALSSHLREEQRGRAGEGPAQ